MSNARRHATPKLFLARGRNPDTRTLVVCAGDSITQAQISANWIGRLRERLGPSHYEFVNAGVNGNLAWNVLQRLDDIIACQPDVVTLLIGTNDIQAAIGPKQEQMFRTQQGITETPTLGRFSECVAAILARLHAETTAAVALVEIPILGEDLSSALNALVIEYNAELHRLAAAFGIECLPFHARIAELIPADHKPPAFSSTVGMMISAALSHTVLRRSWDEVARRNGLIALSDHVHLSDRSAAVLAEEVAGFLERAAPTAGAAASDTAAGRAEAG